MISFHDICMLLSILNWLAQVKLKHLMPLLFFVKANNKKKGDKLYNASESGNADISSVAVELLEFITVLSSSNNDFKKSPWAPILKFSGPNCQQNDSVFWHSIFKKKKRRNMLICLCFCLILYLCTSRCITLPFHRHPFPTNRHWTTRDCISSRKELSGKACRKLSKIKKDKKISKFIWKRLRFLQS